MNCKHLKLKTKKGNKYLYCSLLNKIITFDDCKCCSSKEYKKIVKNYETKKNLEKKSPKISKKNSKITKLERNRKSVFTNDLEHCILCGRKKNELHEIFAGRNRLNSMRYNFVLPLCWKCHYINQNNPIFNDYWHKKARKHFENNIGTREEFIKIFGKSFYKK